MRTALLTLALCLPLAVPFPASAQEPTTAAAPASADTFERELLASLKASHRDKRGIVLRVDGQSVAGVVVAIGPDAVVLSNREFARIVVRRERIAAVESY